MKRIKSRRDIKPGDFYECCNYHPCLCTEVSEDDISGISLVNGGYPMSCSITHCSSMKMSAREAILSRLCGPKGWDKTKKGWDKYFKEQNWVIHSKDSLWIKEIINNLSK